MRFASQEHVHRLEAYAALTAHAKTRCRIWLDQQRRELVKELKAGDVFVLDFLSYLARHGNELSSTCLLYTSPSPRDKRQSRMPSSA